MFEEKKEQFKNKIQEISDMIKELQEEELALNEDIKRLDDLEKCIKENSESNQGKPTFQIEREDLDDITDDFINNGNAWIVEHEKVYHTNKYFSLDRDPKKAMNYINYTIDISLAPGIGRLVSVYCEECKKKFEDTSEDSDRYMYVEEA